MNLDKRKVTGLVEENYVYASVLFYFGIEFYNYSDQTFGEVCEHNGLKPEVVVNSLESLNKSDLDQELRLMALPVDLVIAYLKHKHYLFIKQTLPYLAKLIDHYPASANSKVIADLKLVFPIFVEDSIHHMYEEENKIFNYISTLDCANKGQYTTSQLYFAMETFSIVSYVTNHKVTDDVMRGIRTLTDDYRISAKSTILQNVIYSELQNFEKNLIIHARVENEVLYPKALMLEKQVSKLFQAKIKLN